MLEDVKNCLFKNKDAENVYICFIMVTNYNVKILIEMIS